MGDLQPQGDAGHIAVGAPRRSGLEFAFGLLIILCVASAFRLYRLSHAPVWMDEAFTYLVAQQPLHVILFNEVDNHPPLFYAIEHLWLAVAPGLAALRVPAALAGIGTVIAVAFAVRDLLSPRAGLLAAALLATSTGHIYLSQDARMYTLAVLGVTIAAWGLAGWAAGDRPARPYALLYLCGAVVAVYSHMIGTFCLVSLNAAVLAYLLITREPRARILQWLGINLVLFVLALPWLALLAAATATFPGEKAYGLGTEFWFFRNMAGYPGLPPRLDKIADMLLLATLAAGAFAAWRERSGRALLFVFGALVVLFPVLLGSLNAIKPIFQNRVFVPCALGAAVVAAIAIDRLGKGALFWAWSAALLGFGLWSSGYEVTHRLKNEDVPQALALAAHNGFGNAPIVTNSYFTGGTVYVYAPGQKIYISRDGALLREGTLAQRVYSMPIARFRSNMEPRQMDAMVGGGALVRDPRAEFAHVDKIVMITTNATASDDPALSALGFHMVARPALSYPGRKVLEDNWTTVELWQRKAPSSAAIEAPSHAS